jgi:hypothetical protein
VSAALDGELQQQVQMLFSKLGGAAARKAIPPLMSLADALNKACPPAQNPRVRVPPDVPGMFATAAVEIWLRAVHTFLVSAALTQASPVRATISGYYASHYSMRAFAHLLGYFQLFRRKRIVQLENGRPYCSFMQKSGTDREHTFYWKIVRRHAHFNADPLFTDNLDDVDVSDAAHRNRVTYADHLSIFPQFRVLDEAALRQRVDFISGIQFGMPPIPDRRRYPDTESVQVVAYHRVVRFRRFLDEILGGSNRFWSVHRTPAWAGGIISFQLTDQSTLATLERRR